MNGQSPSKEEVKLRGAFVMLYQDKTVQLKKVTPMPSERLKKINAEYRIKRISSKGCKF